ncbi:hypothetical protein M409DRAFT_62378 [Zasmidium cellare ATCC 36951]|uniref:NAD-dependent epimerase/dehydratase domain-containing protein n=1 Tax=Zasmidium cellare ATCC 36951 TaxID=1080233 RepID=A0A6A6CZT2_ZASCE|nr:uncharacterized protein M409DRAFT_62378 [Zasmidium cellare ATCC 36951]KAF2172611.1 hypothetical protein M409DRAFT_62378 [Zasmidium cellare ATCC 36951]
MVKTLVTGGNGFIAAHIIELLVERGDDVLVTVRSPQQGDKVVEKHQGKAVQYAVVEDITAEGAMDEVFSTNKDIDYVLHTASPFTFVFQDAEKDMLKPAVQGTLETLRSVKAHGSKVKRVVVLSSVVSLMNPGSDSQSSSDIYWQQGETDQTGRCRTSLTTPQTLAEKAAWDFVKDEKPAFDLVSLNPPLVFGPVAHHLSSLEKLNTSNQRVLALMQGKFRDAPLPPTGIYTWVDVRDIALAHIKALEVEAAGGERFAVIGGEFSHKIMADTIGATHPELQDKLPVDAVDDLGSNAFHYHGSKAADILGIKYHSFQDCVDDTVASLQKFRA